MNYQSFFCLHNSDRIRSLEKVTKENERLRSLVHDTKMNSSDFASNAALTADLADNEALPVQKEAPAIENLTSKKPIPREIEGAHLDGAAILALFEQYVYCSCIFISQDMEFLTNRFRSFATHYLHHLPILDLSKPIDRIFNDSSLLFWTIVITATSKHPVHSNYFELLHIPFKHLLSQYLVNSIRCIYTVQALLILCLWPFPVAKQQDDPSWEYIGIAVAAIVKLASNDSQTNWPGSNPLFIDESVRQKTWLGCFLVSTE